MSEQRKWPGWIKVAVIIALVLALFVVLQSRVSEAKAEIGIGDAQEVGPIAPDDTEGDAILSGSGASASAYGSGCLTTYTKRVYWRVNLLITSPKTFSVQYRHKACYQNGQVTYGSAIAVDPTIYGAGAATNWSYNGVVGFTDKDGWREVNGKAHGVHWTQVTIEFRACAPLPLGCILPAIRRSRVQFTDHACCWPGPGNSPWTHWAIYKV